MNAPYGMAKKMLLVQGEAYAREYDLNSQVLLLTNLYGPKDTFDLEQSHVVLALVIRPLMKLYCLLTSAAVTP